MRTGIGASKRSTLSAPLARRPRFFFSWFLNFIGCSLFHGIVKAALTMPLAQVTGHAPGISIAEAMPLWFAADTFAASDFLCAAWVELTQDCLYRLQMNLNPAQHLSRLRLDSHGWWQMHGLPHKGGDANGIVEGVLRIPQLAQ